MHSYYMLGLDLLLQRPEEEKDDKRKLAELRMGVKPLIIWVVQTCCSPVFPEES